MAQLIRIANMKLHDEYKKQYEQGMIANYLPGKWRRISGIQQAEFWIDFMERLLKNGIRKYIQHDTTTYNILVQCINDWHAHEKEYRADTQYTFHKAMKLLNQFYDVELFLLQDMFAEEEWASCS